MKTDYDIRIGFSTTNLFISKIIRWLTGSSCSHSYISFTDKALNMRMVMQAEVWGFELRPWKRWLKTNLLVAEFKPVAGSLHDALLITAQSLGTKFDYKSALLIGLKSLLSMWYKSKFSLNPNNSPIKMTCSEAVVRFLKEGGYKTVKDCDPELTSPAELLREVIQNLHEFEPVYIDQGYLKFDKVIRKSEKIPSAPKDQTLVR